MTVLLAFAAAALFSIGTYLVLQRKLSRIIIGLGLVTHGANVLLITSGSRGNPPIIGENGEEQFSDPLPQALVLTAIVITFAVTMLLLAIAYRSWLLTNDDEVEDDLGDRAVAQGLAPDEELMDEEAAEQARERAELDDEGSPP